MESLTSTVSFDISMDNYFTSFCLLTHLGVNNLWAIGVLKKIGQENALSLRTNSSKKKKKRKKKETWPFKQRNTHQVKKQCTLSRCSAGRFTQLLLNLVNLRDLFGVGTKLKERIFKNNNQMNSTLTTRTWILSTEWIRTLPSTGLVFEW